MQEKKDETELLVHDYFQEITYHYSAGAYASRFFHEIQKNRKIYGNKCPSCSKVYVPPRIVCPECYEELDEWAEVGPQGTVIGCTAVNLAFPDPLTGKVRETPYGFGLIRLDGCSTNWMFFLEESSYEKMKPGMRVEAVFAQERKGDLNDILHFRTVEE
jgi:uncharacterized OB-fold protein